MLEAQRTEDGGHAFPCCFNNGNQAGMSLRDWFAGQALAGLLTREDNYKSTKGAASIAYHAADAMLEARKTP